MLHFPYKSMHRSSDCDETFRNCCTHARGGFGNLKKLKNCTSWSIQCCTFPTGAYTVHLICVVTFKSCCKHARDGIGNLIYSIYKNQCLCRLSVCVCVSRIGAHTVHQIAVKLSQVENTFAMVLEIKKKIKYCTSWSTRCCPPQKKAYCKTFI